MLRLRSIVPILAFLKHRAWSFLAPLKAFCIWTSKLSEVKSWKNLREVKVAKRGNSQSLWNKMCVTFKSLSSLFPHFFPPPSMNITIFTFHLDTFHRQLPNPERRPDLSCELFGASCETPIYLSSLAKGKLVDAQGEATFVPREVTLRWGFFKFLPKFVFWGKKIYLGRFFLMLFGWWGK